MRQSDSSRPEHPFSATLQPVPIAGEAALPDAGAGGSQVGEFASIAATGAQEEVPADGLHQHAGVMPTVAGAAFYSPAARTPDNCVSPEMGDAKGATAAVPCVEETIADAAHSSARGIPERARVEQPALASTSAAAPLAGAALQNGADSDDSSMPEIDSGPDEVVSAE